MRTAFSIRLSYKVLLAGIMITVYDCMHKALFVATLTVQCTGHMAVTMKCSAVQAVMHLFSLLVHCHDDGLKQLHYLLSPRLSPLPATSLHLASTKCFVWLSLSVSRKFPQHSHLDCAAMNYRLAFATCHRVYLCKCWYASRMS